MPAQRLVGDFADRLAEAALERRALLGRVEALLIGFAQEQHVGERPRVLEMLGHRRGAAGPDQIVRILTLGQKREAQALARADQGQRRLDGAERRAASGAVAVEAQDRLARHRPKQRALIGVSAVPSGATTLGKPASLTAIASI